jgi:4-amino-4-deoxy-L-arabinose transferase-like glycosyltransferase
LQQLPEESRGDALPVLAALCCAAALRVVFYSGLTGYDEFAYARIAADIAEGFFRLPDVSGYYGFRYFVIFPAAFFYKLLGYGALSAAAWPFISSLCNTALAYFLGRELSGRRAGVISAFLQAFLPLSVVYGTMLYPEEILALWTGLAALFFLKGSKGEGRWGGAGLLALSGLVAGFGWHTRLNSAVMLLVFAVWLVKLRPRLAHLAVPAGFLAALLAEWIACAALAGDPLFGLRSQLAKLAADTAVYPGGHLVYLRGLLGLDLYGLALFGVSFYLFAAAVTGFARKKRLAQIWLPLVWFAVVFVYLEFGPASLAPYKPVHKQLRFLSMAMFPVLIVAGAYLSELRRGIAWPVLALALAASVIGAREMSAYQAREAAPARLAAGYIKRHAPSAVYADGYLAQYLGYRSRAERSEPYYPGTGAEPGFVRAFERDFPGVPPLETCAVEELMPGAHGRSRLQAAADYEQIRISGTAMLYCFK